MHWIITCLLILIPSIMSAQPQDESEEMVIRLETAVPLMPVYMATCSNENSELSSSQLEKLQEVLNFDFNHNGMTYTLQQSSDKDRLARQFLEGTISSKEWQRMNVFYVITLEAQPGKKMSATLLSVNGSTAKSIDGIVLSGELAQDRKAMHQLADAIHKALFDSEGIATTHILYTIRKKNGKGSWTSEIWESDYDGENARPIIRDGSYSITPTYIPPKPGNRPGSFFYVSYKAAQPKIYMASLRDGSSKRLTSLSGNQLMVSVSQQRDKIALISDVTGNPDLFLQAFNPEEGAVDKPYQIFAAKNATQGSPAFSPDGKQIAFVSNKDGSPRIYVMDVPAPGTSLKKINAQLVTKHAKESSAPSWSPDGTKLAYCAQVNGVRQIWIYDFNTKEERQLTKGPGNKENPSWAPNSLNLVYNSTDTGSYDLYLINLNQPHATKITSGPGEKRFPSWEPRS